MEKISREHRGCRGYADCRLYEGKVPDHRYERHHLGHPQHHDLPWGGADQLGDAERGCLRQGEWSEEKKRIRDWGSARKWSDKIIFISSQISLSFITPSGFCLHLAGSAYKKYLHLRGDYLLKKGEGSYKSQPERGNFFAFKKMFRSISGSLTGHCLTTHPWKAEGGFIFFYIFFLYSLTRNDIFSHV